MEDTLVNPSIFLVDDHAMFRTGLRMVIHDAIPAATVFDVGALDEALSHPVKTIDVVLLDIKLDSGSGLEGISRIKDKWPGAAIVVLSSQDDPNTCQEALDKGADKFVSKSETSQRMVVLVQQLLHMQPPPLSNGSHITDRQREIIHLLFLGLSNKLIARQLKISENTVRRHIQDILDLFQVSTRAEAVYEAHRRNLVG